MDELSSGTQFTLDVSRRKSGRLYKIMSKRVSAYSREGAQSRGALIKYFLLTNLIKHLFLTKTIVIQYVAIVQRLKRIDIIGTRALQVHGLYHSLVL